MAVEVDLIYSGRLPEAFQRHAATVRTGSCGFGKLCLATRAVKLASRVRGSGRLQQLRRIESDSQQEFLDFMAQQVPPISLRGPGCRLFIWINRQRRMPQISQSPCGKYRELFLSREYRRHGQGMVFFQ